MKSPVLNGETIFLRPLTFEDKESFYQWATNSEATPYWYGDLYGDTIPDRQTFFTDWTDEYFSDIAMDRKRSFAIVVSETGDEIGQINYQLDEDEAGNRVYDLDIIIAKNDQMGKGYGSASIARLSRYLLALSPGISLTLYALKSNARAIQAYEKAGFRQQKEFSDNRGNEWIKLVMQPSR